MSSRWVENDVFPGRVGDKIGTPLKKGRKTRRLESFCLWSSFWLNAVKLGFCFAPSGVDLMTSFIDELFEDIAVGDLIKVTYGTSENQSSTTGSFQKRTESLLTLVTRNGKAAKIRVDDIRSLEPAEYENDAVDKLDVPTTENHWQSAILPPAAPEATDTQAVSMALKSVIFSLPDSNVRNAFFSALDSFQSAIKNNCLDDKYGAIASKLMQIEESCSPISKEAALCMDLFHGALLYGVGEYAPSAQRFAEANNYQLASIAANADGNQNASNAFFLLYLASCGNPSCIDQRLADVCLRLHEITPLGELLERYEEEESACEAIIACALYVLRGANFSLLVPIEQTDSAKIAFQKISNSFPPSWQQQDIEALSKEAIKQYCISAGKQKREMLTGTISSYYRLNDWGFIKGSNGESIMFHSAQVDTSKEESELLLKLLKDEKAEGLEILYNKKNDYQLQQGPEIEDITLTEEGLRLAEKRLSPKKKKSTKKSNQQKRIIAEPINRSVAKPASIQPNTSSVELSKAVSEGKQALLKKEFGIAEDNFKYVLEFGSSEQITNILGDCVTLYLQQPGRAQDALSILEKHGSLLPRRSLRNNLITVYEKQRDYAALIPLCEESFRDADRPLQKNHELLRIVRAYTQLGKYHEALEACDRWDSFCQQNQFSPVAESLRKGAPAFNRHRAICLYNLGYIDDAKKVARSLVQENPSDSAANAILDGSLTKDTAGSAGELIEGYAAFFDEDFGTSVQIIKESKFVSDQIDEIDIAIQQKYRVSEGEYVGDIKAAKNDVDALLRRPMQSPKTRFDTRLTACKIIQQVESKCQRTGETSPWPQNYVIRLAGRAMASWGDFKASSGQLDTCRMAYLFALKVLTASSTQNIEQDWVNSYNRYLRSFYLGAELSSYITEQQQAPRGEAVNTDLFATKRLNDFTIPAFLVGMLNLVSALENQTKERDELISDLYGKNPELRKALCKQLSVFEELEVSESLGSETFKARIEQASELLQARMNTLREELNEVASLFMLDGIIPDEVLARLDIQNWEKYLSAADANRLQQLAEIVIDAQNYYRNYDFDARSDCLRTALLKLKDLQQSIRTNPTELSYESMLPVISTMYGRIVESQSELYRSYAPELTWEENVQPSKSPDGTILAQLLVKNEVNHQAAEALTIETSEICNGEEIVSAEQIPPIDRLRGGESKELLLNITLTREAAAAGNFTLRIPYSFRYKRTPQSITDCPSEVTFSMIVRNDEGKPFSNPYEIYSGGNPIDDEDDEMFYGREVEKAEIVKVVRRGDSGQMNYGRAIAMYGQTRTGKTSLLGQIRNEIMNRHEGHVLLCDMENIGDIPIDAGNPDRFLAGFLYQMLVNCCDSIYDNPALSGDIDLEAIEPPLEMIKDPSIAASLFNERMRRLNRILIAHDVVILLIIDEFTYLHGLIKRGEVTSYFMQFWKALLQNYCVFAIVVGQDDMPEFMHEYPNEFACMELIKLTYLDEQAAKRLIHEPLEHANGIPDIFQKAAIDEIYKLTAGSAYLTMKICDGLVKYLNEKGARVVTPGIVEDFLVRKALGVNGFLVDYDFEPQLRERGHREYTDDNKAVLIKIARESKGGRSVPRSRIQCDGMSPEYVEMLLGRLVDRNVLIKTNGEYEIQVKLFERWLISEIGE